MQASKVLLTIALAGAGTWAVYSQPANPELQAKALELLRQTISQQGQPGAQAAPAQPAPAPARPAAAKPAQATPAALAPAQPAPASLAPASAEQQQKALELLRQKMAEEAPAAGSASRAKPAKPATGAKAAAEGQPTTPAQPNLSAVTPAAASPGGNAPAVAAPPSLSASKQQRLNELLDKYRADQLNPTQYHEQRAKILAEP
jgi:hypothetical protein